MISSVNENKAAERQKIQDDVEAFLRKGGTIDEVPIQRRDRLSHAEQRRMRDKLKRDRSSTAL